MSQNTKTMKVTEKQLLNFIINNKISIFAPDGETDIEWLICMESDEDEEEFSCLDLRSGLEQLYKLKNNEN